MKLYVLRHGESVGNVDTTVYGRIPNSEMELTEKGHAQANAVAETLKNTLQGGLANVYSSPYKRTIQTSEAITKKINHIFYIEILLHEQEYGAVEGSTLTQFFKKKPEEKRLHGLFGFLYYRLPGGESLSDVYQRCGLFFNKVDRFRTMRYINNIVVAHKGVCLMLESYITRTTERG